MSSTVKEPKYKVDPKIEPLLGFYIKENDFLYFTFDSEQGYYWAQMGYCRINNSWIERKNVVKRYKTVKTIEERIKKSVQASYSKQPIPKELVIRTHEQCRADYVGKDTENEQTEEVQVELKEGMIKIANQVLEVKKGDFDYVPRLNESYFFPEITNDVIMDITERKPILLTGHTGCGKTSLFEQIASRINQSVVRSNMNGQTTVGDFVGMWTVKAGETVWVDGVLPRAMKEGQWLVIDEIDCADAQILAILNAVLEKNGVLTLKEKGFEVVRPHQDFRIFATANTVGCMQIFRSLYQGTNIMNEAFLDRFRVYHVDYLPKIEEVKVLVATVPEIRPEVAQIMVETANTVRNEFQKQTLECTFSTRRLIDWAEMYCRHKNLKKSAENVIYSKISREDAKVIDGYITRVGKF